MDMEVAKRDRSKAAPFQYVAERTELLSPAMPSVVRRLLVIAAYAIGCFVVAALVEYGTMRAGLLSAACVADDRCLRSESLLMNGFGLLLIGAWVGCVIQGWRGRLYGCRGATKQLLARGRLSRHDPIVS